MRMRRATRRVTQLYDHALEPAGLTVTQFGLLAFLQGASLARSIDLSVGTITEKLGMDPTTLTRNLKPLARKGLVRNTIDPADGHLSIGTIAEWLGMDPTTLNRNLKPLSAKGLVTNAIDPADGRVRFVQITDKGRRVLLKAVPLWRDAQAQVDSALGPEATASLNNLLDLSAARLRSAG